MCIKHSIEILSFMIVKDYFLLGLLVITRGIGRWYLYLYLHLYLQHRKARDRQHKKQGWLTRFRFLSCYKLTSNSSNFRKRVVC